MMNDRIQGSLTFPAKHVDIKEGKMHYVEAGEGDPILFLHGIPTSCYLWRNIIPHLSPLGRCIAPDLMGFGWSDKPSINYSIANHINHLNQFIKALDLKNLILVMHGWGSVIGFDYAMKHEKNCKGLAFYEAFLHVANGENISLVFEEQLLSLREQGKETLETENGLAFIEKMLLQQMMHPIAQEEMHIYRQPFSSPGTAKPILQYLRELPSGEEEKETQMIMSTYTDKLAHSALPKLMLYSVPGLITTMETIMWAKNALPHLEAVDIGEELHLGQESCPDLIGETISVWLQGIEQS